MSSQTQFVGTGANDTSVGTVAWSSPTSITSDNGTNATFTSGGATSNYLKGTNCGFSIPSGATIDGIVVTIERGYVAGNATDSAIRIVKGGTIGSANKSTGASWSSSMTVVNYGGASDLWSETWTDTDINASNFGAVLSISTTGVSPANVDYMSITVYYTEAGGGPGSGSFWADAFMTFRSVAIPRNVTINKAFVRFTAKSGTGNVFTVTNDEDTVETMIFGNDVDDSSPPTDVSTYTSKDLTSNCQNWSEIAHWTNETTYDTPDIACIIQEIVDRAGWASGNDISIYVQNNFGTEITLHDVGRRAYDYGTDNAKAPQLFVYYTMDETMSGGVVCGGSADSQRLYSPTITPNGVLCSGSATVGYIANPVVVAAGVIVAGRAALQTDFTGSGGVVCGGHGALVDYVTWNGGVIIGSYPYQYRMIITVPAATTSTDLAAFPLIATVEIDPTHMANENDWTVTDTSRRELAHELRRYDSDTGRLTIAVKTNINHSADTTVWLLYGAQT